MQVSPGKEINIRPLSPRVESSTETTARTAGVTITSEGTHRAEWHEITMVNKDALFSDRVHKPRGDATRYTSFKITEARRPTVVWAGLPRIRKKENSLPLERDRFTIISAISSSARSSRIVVCPQR